MSRRNKKRTKRYQGEDAATDTSSAPVIHRYEAVSRNRLSQWWFERKKVITTTAKISGVILIVIWLIYELLRITTSQ